MVGDMAQCTAAFERLKRQCTDLLQGTAGLCPVKALHLTRLPFQPKLLRSSQSMALQEEVPNSSSAEFSKR